MHFRCDGDLYKPLQTLVTLGYSFCVNRHTGGIIAGSGHRGGQDCSSYDHTEHTEGERPGKDITLINLRQTLWHFVLHLFCSVMFHCVKCCKILFSTFRILRHMLCGTTVILCLSVAM